MVEVVKINGQTPAIHTGASQISISQKKVGRGVPPGSFAYGIARLFTIPLIS